MAYIGSRIKRKEDVRLLRGIGKYVGDIHRVGMAHAVILRSTHAHARIVNIDASRAVKMEGVTGVLTAADMPGLKTIPMRTGHIPGLERSQQTPLATTTARYVGDPLAVVVAENRYVAEDALELIDVQYEALGAVTGARESMQPGAVQVHEAVANNIAANFQVNVGDVDAGFAASDLIVEEEFSTQRHAAVPLETRGLVAEFDLGTGLLTMWGPTKMTHTNWRILSELTGLPQSCIHFIEPEVGGGFGARGEFYPEDFLIPFAAMHFHRPICWIEDRSENLKAMNQSRQQQHRVKIGLKRDGTIVAMDAEILFDMGGYTRTHGGVPAIAASAMLRGPLGIKNYRCNVFCVLTNKTPVGTYRSPGRYEANFVRERLLDLAAHRLKLDPADIRRRNLIRHEEMPYDLGKHPFHFMVYDTGDFPGQFERALERIGYEELKSTCAAAKQQGRAMGVGIGCFVETSGIGPWEYARVEIDTSGKVVLYSGCNSVGQGIATALSQIVADELRVPIDDVRVVHGDTAKVPYGNGSNASRSTVMAGSAALGASRKVKDKLLRLAAGSLEIDAADLFLRDGKVSVRGAPERSLSLAQIAALALPGPALKSGLTPGISEEDFFATDKRPFPYGVHIAVVEVDRETGQLKILDYLVTEDVGRKINPMIIEGQMAGGLAQGIGGALLEEFVYDDDGQPLATSFMDYLMPTAMEMPKAQFISTEDFPTPHNPLGVKGAGEGGITAAGAALANAVSNALDVEVKRLPLRPDYILDLLRNSADHL
ncbi:MAG TPA: xanthine dehydrogenase family protein molybdopterin-binding subunit [Candidatus Udaeobacter sp.]|jgi:carbon-monoxide dehydrogenase large subunit|nr:xanthine dehydrogenase family protein molybdopterin-binding subunit [Candidatus Udaeobacter sp.]